MAAIVITVATGGLALGAIGPAVATTFSGITASIITGVAVTAVSEGVGLVGGALAGGAIGAGINFADISFGGGTYALDGTYLTDESKEGLYNKYMALGAILGGMVGGIAGASTLAVMDALIDGVDFLRALFDGDKSDMMLSLGALFIPGDDAMKGFKYFKKINKYAESLKAAGKIEDIKDFMKVFRKVDNLDEAMAILNRYDDIGSAIKFIKSFDNVNDGLKALGKFDNIDDVFKNIDNIYKQLTDAQIDDLARWATQNPNADSLMLGLWDDGGSGSYVNKAIDNGSSYYSMGSTWDDIAKVTSPEDMWRINQRVIDNAIADGKTIKFSHNPNNIKSLNPKSGFVREVKYLESLGYRFTEMTGGGWSAVK